MYTALRVLSSCFKWKNNVCVCWLVILRHFISENREIITSDKKVPKKASVSLFPSFRELRPVLPLREPFPAHLSWVLRGIFFMVISSSPTGLFPAQCVFLEPDGFLTSRFVPFPPGPPNSRKSDLLGTSGLPERADPGKGSAGQSQGTILYIATETGSPCVTTLSVSQKEQAHRIPQRQALPNNQRW